MIIEDMHVSLLKFGAKKKTSAETSSKQKQSPLVLESQVELAAKRIGPKTRKAFETVQGALNTTPTDPLVQQVQEHTRRVAKKILAPLKQPLEASRKTVLGYFPLAADLEEIPPLGQQDNAYLKQVQFVQPPTAQKRPARKKGVNFKIPTQAEINALKGTLNYTVPVSETTQSTGIIRTRIRQSELTPQAIQTAGKPTPTGILMSYGVQWPLFKRLRDMTQNFFDAHRLDDKSGTLEFVGYTISRPKGKGPYKVTIHGHGEYPYNHVLEMGASGKTETRHTAGINGEGSKIVPLLFLRDNKVKNWAYSSANWRLEYSKGINPQGDEELFYKLDKLAKPIEGNTLSFETEDPKLIHRMLQGVRWFRHPEHRDFSNPTFNMPGVGGFEILPRPRSGKPYGGNVYVAGQRLQVENAVTGKAQITGGLPGINAWIDNRPDGIGRDRPALSIPEVMVKVLEPVIQKMPNTELIRTIYLLRRQWQVTPQEIETVPKAKSERALYVGENAPLLELLVEEARHRNLQTRFSNKYVAVSNEHFPTLSQLTAYEESGKIPCWPAFRDIGMVKRRPASFSPYIRPFIALPNDVQAAELIRATLKQLGSHLPVEIDSNKLQVPFMFFADKRSTNLPEGEPPKDGDEREIRRHYPIAGGTKQKIKIPAVFWHPEKDCLYLNIEELRNPKAFNRLLRQAIIELSHSRYSTDSPMVGVKPYQIAELATQKRHAQILRDAKVLFTDITSSQPVVAETNKELEAQRYAALRKEFQKPKD